MRSRGQNVSLIYHPNIMKKHLFRVILIACDTIITRVQGSASRYV